MGDFEVIETKADLEALAQDLMGSKIIAIDTEADRFYHYFDKTCLVQIADRKNIYLLDPIALGGPAELAPLGPVFASPDITKIFHAAEYDLFVLTRDCSFTFHNLFDTMVSAQLLGYPSVGLASLAERHFGVHMPKDEQRSDWSRRPLTQRQLNYAASDVLYLIELTEKLTRELKAAKRLRWAQEEFETLCGRKWPERSFDKLGYLRIKAREIDRPPFKVLGNRTLLDISDQKPRKLAELAEIKGITELLLRRMGREIMAAVREGRKVDHGPIPKMSSGRRRIDRHAERRMLALKKWRTQASERLAMDPGVLCPNLSLEAIAWRAPESPKDLLELPELKGWFNREFGSEVTEVCKQDDVAARSAPRSSKQSGSRGGGRGGGSADKSEGKKSAARSGDKNPS